jgi:hypothetical protein
MRVIKVFIASALLFVFAFGVLCQTEGKRSSLRYPNELKGFELMKTSPLKTLIPGISTASEAQEKTSFFMKDCKPAYSELVSGCQLDKDWDVSYAQIDTLQGNLDSIVFYPRKRIPFSKVKFPKQFKKSQMGIVHSINAGEFISYRDKYGLEYVIVDESGDSKYKKGDLFYIEYGLSDEERDRQNLNDSR